MTNYDDVERGVCSTRRASSPASSGAIASVAVRIAEMDEGNVVFIVCDDGWKYLSSGVYTLPVEESRSGTDSTVWW